MCVPLLATTHACPLLPEHSPTCCGVDLDYKWPVSRNTLNKQLAPLLVYNSSTACTNGLQRPEPYNTASRRGNGATASVCAAVPHRPLLGAKGRINQSITVVLTWWPCPWRGLLDSARGTPPCAAAGLGLLTLQQQHCCCVSRQDAAVCRRAPRGTHSKTHTMGATCTVELQQKGEDCPAPAKGQQGQSGPRQSTHKCAHTQLHSNNKPALKTLRNVQQAGSPGRLTPPCRLSPRCCS